MQSVEEVAAERFLHSCAKLHAHAQNSWVESDVKNTQWREFNFSPPHTNQLLMVSSSKFFSCLDHKSFSTHQHSHLTLMAPSAVLCDSTWNNTETLVTVKGFNPECFSTDSRGTCADIPGILRWIALFPGSKVYDGSGERTEPHLLKSNPKHSHVFFCELHQCGHGLISKRKCKVWGHPPPWDAALICPVRLNRIRIMVNVMSH